MRVLLAWGVAVLNAVHYTLFKFRLMSLPQFRRYPTHWEPFLGSFLLWRRRMTVLHPERCPADRPVVFASLHSKLDDPLFCWGAVHRATNGVNSIYFMMRDDFFRGWPWDYLPFSMNEITEAAGCIQISRDSISLAQLKPLVNVLERGESFVMYPGRTRSRSGRAIDYIEGIEEPGGVSFFLVHGSRRAGQPVGAIPVARTYDPLDKHTYVSFGETRYLPEGAGREAQRDFDFNLAVEMSNQIVVTPFHALCVLIFLRCVHGRIEARSCSAWSADVSDIMSRITGQVETPPALDIEAAVPPRLAWMQEHGILRLDGEEVTILSEAVLVLPEVGTKFRKENPVRFYTNQVMHFRAVAEAAEAVVLD